MHACTQDVLNGDVQEAVLFNYMFELTWLLDACPALATYPRVVLIHGEHGDSKRVLEQYKTPNMRLHQPRLPIPYGAQSGAQRALALAETSVARFDKPLALEHTIPRGCSCSTPPASAWSSPLQTFCTEVHM